MVAACLQDVVAPCYASLLAEASQLLGPSAAYHALWPQSSVQMPWDCIIPRLYDELRQHAVVHTSALGGRWLQPAAAVYADEACQR